MFVEKKSSRINPWWTEDHCIPLENGDQLDRREFENRWEGMPNLKRAELIEGVVFVGELVKASHGSAHAVIGGGWLNNYALMTEGVDCRLSCSICLDDWNVPQPDALLRLPAALGGTSRVEDDILCGPPDLIAEVCPSRASRELNQKLRIYERFGVREYVVWRTHEHAIDWFVLREGRYQPAARDAKGWYKSQLFPGLWLDPEPLTEPRPSEIHAMFRAGIGSNEHLAFIERLKLIAPEE